MANKAYTFEMDFTFKSEGNRGQMFTATASGTTVHRAFNKVAKDIEEGRWQRRHESHVIPGSHPNEDVRASDLMLLGARIVKG